MSKPFAVFDIDGTLIRWQLYHAVVDKLAKAGALGENAHQKIHDARMVWKRREFSEAFKAYEKLLVELYEQGLKKLKGTVFDELVSEVINEYRDQTYVYTRELLKNLKKDNYLLLAISGSHHELVEQIARYYDFDDWIGTHYERRGGGFSGKKYVGSADKKKELELLLAKHQPVYSGSIAVGDSGSDIAMLEMVERPIAFNPDRTLFEVAAKHGWQVVVERKNMIYELQQRAGIYSLSQ